MAAKTTAWGFSFLKEATLVLTRLPKLLAPFLLYAVIILTPKFKRVYVNPLTTEISRYLTEMEEHADPLSAEYTRLLQEETQQKARVLLVISIAEALVTLTLAFAKQIVAFCCFAASSTTNSESGPGDRYSATELLREVTKWNNMRFALITAAAVVTVVQLASMAFLDVNLVAVLMWSSELLLSARDFSLLVVFGFLYVGVLALAIVGVRRKEWSALVVLTLLLSALLIPLCELAVLYVYAEEIMGFGHSLLSVYDILEAVQGLLYLSAASVYHSYQCKAMEERKD